jgi:hypothetical protein
MPLFRNANGMCAMPRIDVAHVRDRADAGAHDGRALRDERARVGHLDAKAVDESALCTCGRREIPTAIASSDPLQFNSIPLWTD